MKRLKLVLVSVVVGMVGIACGDAEVDGGVSARDETAAQQEVSRKVIAQAGRSGAQYGREHLGHYLKLEKRDLRRYGFEAPAGISVDVSSTHTSYCIRVTNEALPSIHPWRVGTVSSRDGEGSSADHCRK